MQTGELKFTVLGELALSQFFRSGTGVAQTFTKILFCFNNLS